MEDTKQKERSKPTIRVPKLKSGLPELKLRPALPHPHDDLIPSTIQSTPNTSIKDEPVSKTDRFIGNTGPDSIPASSEPVSKPTPVAKLDRYQKQTGIKNDLVLPLAPYTEPKTNYFKVPNEVADRWLAVLDDDEFKIYFRLLRLSHGFQQTTCFVGYTALARACKMSLSKVKRVVPRLMAHGLVRVVEVHNEAKKKGTVYEVNTDGSWEPVSEPDRSTAETGVAGKPNKKDDDDLKSTDHHQRQTMMMYQKLTGNNWGKADHETYKKIQHIEPSIIEQGIQLAMNRAKDHPNSLGYFVKQILRLANPPARNRAQTKRELKKIVDRCRNLHAGGRSYTISELSDDVKERCAREGILFDNDLFSEVIGLG